MRSLHFTTALGLLLALGAAPAWSQQAAEPQTLQPGAVVEGNEGQVDAREEAPLPAAGEPDTAAEAAEAIPEVDPQRPADAIAQELDVPVQLASLLRTRFGDRLDMLFADLDVDRTGGLSIDELLGEAGAGLDTELHAGIVEEFNAFAGEDEQLAETEFDALGMAGTELGARFGGQLDMSFGDLDADGNGTVSFDEFLGEEAASLDAGTRATVETEFGAFVGADESLTENEFGQMQTRLHAGPGAIEPAAGPAGSTAKQVQTGDGG